ncbi:MAG: hypothetical protein ONB11_04555 [candidate division KSB1 bacterium]|nr:hypothetical protein [candidate division KSB1 bacterium]
MPDSIAGTVLGKNFEAPVQGNRPPNFGDKQRNIIIKHQKSKKFLEKSSIFLVFANNADAAARRILAPLKGNSNFASSKRCF